MKKVFYILILCSSLFIKASAQNNNSPYSIIGIGDIERSSFDRTTGMGSAGLALSSNRFMYQNNPASYAALDFQFIYFDIAARYRSTNYAGTPIVDPTQASSSDVQFKKIAFAVKLKRRWAISIGISPYSTVNYSFLGNKSILGTNFSSNAYYTGTGSTNKLYVNNSFAITKDLLVGIEVNDVFGQIKETETIAPGILDSTLITSRNITLAKIYFKAGIKYGFNVNKKLKLSFGGTITNKANIDANYALLVTSGNSTITNNQNYKNSYFTLPASYSGGAAATFNDKYSLAADYSLQKWSTNQTTGLNYTLVDTRKMSLGFEYSNKVNYYNQTYEKYYLQTGLFYSDSYLNINGNQLKDYGLTLGYGTQLKRSGLGIQCALEVGITGTTNNNLIKETYSQFNVIFSYRDLWFIKRKYE